MLRFAIIAGLAGIAVDTTLVAREGVELVTSAMAVAGWGIVWTSLFRIVPIAAATIGWRYLMPLRKRPSHLFLFWSLWVREAVNSLLPVARVGGEIASVTLLSRHGISKSQAIASLVVETTISVVAVFFFVLLGVGLLLAKHADNSLLPQLTLGIGGAVLVVAIFIAVQKIGLFGILNRLLQFVASDHFQGFAQGSARLDRAIALLYARRRRAWLCFIWQFISWALGAGEIWLALFFLGHPLGITECVIFEAMIQAIANAAFFVPGALGVQEGGFLVFGSLLGLAPETALALALVRRCRDIMIYLPVLVIWQVTEGRRALRR